MKYWLVNRDPVIGLLKIPMVFFELAQQLLRDIMGI